MRQTISGLVAAFAVMVAGAAPAMACGGGLFQGSCSPCGQAYVEPCAQPQVYQPPVYVPPAPVYSGCNTCGRGWGYERLVEPETQYYAALMRHQYYYVNQGPTYSGPGSFAPYPAYEENAVPSYGYGYGYQYGYRHHRPWYNSYRYGHAPHHYAYRHWGHEGYYWGHPLVRRYY